jgi:hypothetical protein
MDILIGGVLLTLAIWSILVLLNNNAAGGWLFDHARWPFVVGAWVLVVLLWGGRGAYGIYHERNVLREQIRQTIEAFDNGKREATKAAVGIDPLAKFITESDTESDTSDN